MTGLKDQANLFWACGNSLSWRIYFRAASSQEWNVARLRRCL